MDRPRLRAERMLAEARIHGWARASPAVMRFLVSWGVWVWVGEHGGEGVDEGVGEGEGEGVCEGEG